MEQRLDSLESSFMCLDTEKDHSGVMSMRLTGRRSQVQPPANPVKGSQVEADVKNCSQMRPWNANAELNRHTDVDGLRLRYVSDLAQVSFISSVGPCIWI